MKIFATMELREAQTYAASGGQALHLHNIIVNERTAPQCFIRAVRRGEWIAHLFDNDVERLTATARRLGVNVIVVEHQGHKDQHIDLCGRPLRKALVLAGGCEEDIRRPLEDDEEDE